MTWFPFLGLFHALAWAKNTLWALPCLSVCLSVAFFTYNVGNLQDRGYCCSTMGIYCCESYCYCCPYCYSCCHCCSYFCSLALPSPGWTPLCLYHGFDHLGLKEDRDSPPRVFTTHGPRSLLGTASPGDTPRQFPLHLVPTGIFYLTPGALPPKPFPAVLALLGPGPLRFLFLELCPPGFLPWPTRVLEIHFLPSQGFGHDGLDLHWSPQSFSPSGLPHFGASPSVALPLDLAFVVLDTPSPYHIMLDHPYFRRFWTAPEKLCDPRGWATFGDLAPFGAPPGNVPNAYLTPGALPPRPFLRILASLGPVPLRLLPFFYHPGYINARTI
jgi:hypothetical protein